ncbi:MAG: relaxase [Hyphomicrobiaceae bacterium]|nr:relaxase [Hyphomicrobiaceae bacterium]
MILKGSQRGGGQDLAGHLLRMDENEHVRVHELRGFASDGLPGAFREAEAVARGTRCRQYLFSLSFNPPEGAAVTEAAFEDAIDRAENTLGLTGQPRAVVFHEKEGRRHAHCVWSRIDPETMTARPMSFFKTRLTPLSRDLYLEHGWDMPRGLAEKGARDPGNFTLAQWQQAKRQGRDPRWLSETVQSCWQRSDSRAAFIQSLQERGLHLAKGDRRGFVAVDYTGEVHALSRLLGVKARAVHDRLGEGNDLPGVSETRARLAEQLGPAMKRHISECRMRFQQQASGLAQAKVVVTQRHREERAAQVRQHETDLMTGARDRAARLPTGWRAVWHRLTGRYRHIVEQNVRAAQAQADGQAVARDRLIEAQSRERAGLQHQIKALRNTHAEELKTLRSEVGRYLGFARQRSAEQSVLEPGPHRQPGRSTPGRTAGRRSRRGLGLGRQ